MTVSIGLGRVGSQKMDPWTTLARPARPARGPALVGYSAAPCIDFAHYRRRPHSMRGRVGKCFSMAPHIRSHRAPCSCFWVRVTVGCSFVRPSVSLSRRSVSAACRSLGAGSRYRFIAAGARAGAAGSRCRRINNELCHSSRERPQWNIVMRIYIDAAMTLHVWTWARNVRRILVKEVNARALAA